MIEVDSLLYKIDQKLNKLSTNDHQQIQLEDKILALNEAQLLLIKQKMNGFSTPSGLGLDSFKKRYQDLQILAVDFTVLPIELTDTTLNKWTGDLTTLSPVFMFYLDSYVLANKDRCKNQIIWINRELSKHGDLQFLINNTNYSPSFEYRETFNVISSNKISIFTDASFTPTKYYIMYLRYPQYIDKEGYIHFDGTASINTNCELELYLEDELIDLTVQNLGMYTENMAAVHSSQLRIQTNE